MPAPPKPLYSAAPKSVALSTVDGSMELQQAPEWARSSLQKGDWSSLSESQRWELLTLFCAQYGLDARKGVVAVIKLKNGAVVPYIKAQGVFDLTRDDIRSVQVSEPKIVFEKGRPYLVHVNATITDKKGNTFENIGCVKVNSFDELDFAIHKAATAAQVRALKLAIGIHLISDIESEAVTAVVTQEGKREQ